MKSEHTAELIAALGSLLAEAPVIEVCRPIELGDPAKGLLAGAMS